MLYNNIIPRDSYLSVHDKENDRNKNAVATGCNFSDIYLTYYSKLLRFAREYVVVTEEAENIIQDVFVKLWERQDTLHLVENMNAYLFRLTKNRCLDHLRHKLSTEKCNKAVQNSFEIELNLKIQSLDKLSDTFLAEKNMEEVITEAINSLPPKCREIFILSRYEGLKYREISEHFNISVNTVENQMSIALKKLRLKLKDYIDA